MTVSTAFEGRAYAPGPIHVVSAQKIAEFARATGATSPLYTDEEAARAAGYRSVPAPPTFAVSLAQETEAQYVQDPDAGIDFSRVVHGEERFVHHRPILAGDRLRGALTVERIRKGAASAMITTRVDLSDDAGNPVSTVTSMLVVRDEEDA